MPSPGSPAISLLTAMHRAQFAFSDSLRRSQANALGALGLAPQECPFRIVASGKHWRLRDYGGGDCKPPLLIIAAPIKRPYIWDLAPNASALRFCLANGLRVFLLEWVAPYAGDAEAGLAEYAGEGIAACVQALTRNCAGQPVLMGHSLGGTLAAVYGAIDPHSISGLVLLSSPLCFARASSPFRDSLVSILPPAIAGTAVVAGSLLSQASAMASPKTFLFSRWLDAALSAGDPEALEIHNRVERWALDEVALPGRLVKEIVEWLYCEDRFCRGALQIGERTLGPRSLRVPTLAAVTSADDVVPASSVAPFIARMAAGCGQLIEYPGEAGVCLQHVALLAGRRTYVEVWPQILAWIKGLERGAAAGTQQSAAQQ